MISYQNAIEFLGQNTQLQPSETVVTKDSLMRIISNDVYSPIDLPNFDNSAMDGFAIRYDETSMASPENPVLLKVTDTIAAEIVPQKSATEFGTCHEIMTGAAIPVGYDAVIQLELIEEVIKSGERYIKLTAPVTKNHNVRFSGEDVQKNSLVFKVGQRIDPSALTILLSLGIAKVVVFKPIEIAIASSGNEISDQYDINLRYGEIYNSNSPLLLSLASSKNFSARYFGILNDEESSLYSYIQNSTEQILITTGAVSKGKWDFIPETLIKMGAKIIFHSVAIRPGKPILFARLKDGRYFFGLPGNPVSTMIGWRFFIIPLLYAMLGQKPESACKFRMNSKFKKSHNLRQFLKAKINIDSGVASFTISKNQESFKIKSLSECDAWAIVPEFASELSAGDLIDVVPLYANI